jgi:hypothetical protein
MVITGLPHGEVAGIGISTSVVSKDDGYLYYGGGIGVDLIYPAELDKVLVIDPTLDYEISFKVDKSAIIDSNLTFGVALFDSKSQPVDAVKVTDGLPSNRFFTLKTLNQAGTQYWVRGVLYAHNTALITGDTLNIGFGQILKSVPNAVYLAPIIIIENNSGVIMNETVNITDIKIRPAALWTSRGALSARNFIVGFLKNRSVQYNNQQVEKLIDSTLIPYNTFSLLKFL